MDKTIREKLNNIGRISESKFEEEELKYIYYRTSYLENVNLNERCYHIKFNLFDYPKCCCSNKITSFLRFKVGYRNYCSVSCAVITYKSLNPELENERKQKIKNTFDKKPMEEKYEKSKRVMNSRIKNGNMRKPSFSVFRNKMYKLYSRRVRVFTNRIDVRNLENYERRAKKGYHLDHIFSIRDGFLNNIPPFYLATISNLQFMHYKENCRKSSKSYISKEELFEIYHQDLINRRFNDYSERK